jgi:hypothetical protein
VYRSEDESIVNKYLTDNFYVFFNNVVTSDKFKKKFGHKNFHIDIYVGDHEHDHSYCCFHDDNKLVRDISLVQEHVNDKCIILHELSHAVQDFEVGHLHLENFCADYLWLVKNFIGHHAHQSLMNSMKINGVKYKVSNENSVPVRHSRTPSVY